LTYGSDLFFIVRITNHRKVGLLGHTHAVLHSVVLTIDNFLHHNQKLVLMPKSHDPTLRTIGNKVVIEHLTAYIVREDHHPAPEIDKKWKKFERLVAAIHMAENSGATVTWNEHINGRQFDVAIRFKSQFYDYLTLIECKDEQTRVEAEDVDAFVTKSRDAGANKAIIVSSSGFQSGAKIVAENHNLDLYTLTEIHAMPQKVPTDSIIALLTVLPVGFWKSGTGEIIEFSTNSSQCALEIEKTALTGYGDQTVLGLLKAFLRSLIPFDIPPDSKFEGSFPIATRQQQYIAISLADGTNAIFPGNSDAFPVSHLLVSYWMEDMRFRSVSDPP
jgi:hypothetical protein